MSPPTCGVINTVRRCPQWVVGGERFGVGDVEGGTQTSSREFSDQCISVDDWAPGNVDDQGPIGQGSEELAIDQLMRRWAVGDRQDDDVSRWQQVVQLVDSVDSVARRPRHHLQIYLERCQPCSDRRTHRTCTEKHDATVGECIVPCVQPGAFVLCAQEAGKPSQTRNGKADGQLCGARIVDAGGVAERHASRKVGQHVIDAGGEGLHHPQRCHRIHHFKGLVRPHVFRNIKSDVAHRSWDGLAASPNLNVQLRRQAQVLRPVIVGEPYQRHGCHRIRRACLDKRPHDGAMGIKLESGGGVAKVGRRQPRAVALVVVVVLAVAAVAVIGTQWKVLPWVPDAATFGTATPPDASSTPPEVGEPIDLATDLAVPWGLTFLPDGRALVGERTTGEVSVIVPGGAAEPIGAVPNVADNGEGGLLGIVASPTFEDDRLIYAYVTTNTDNRVITMELGDNVLTNPRAILTGIPDESYHDGGRLLFGPDGMLYATTGDAGVPENAQDLSSLSGKILRVNADGSVPDDNPFPGSPVWSYGHRNVQGLAFDDAGRLWASEFGSSAYDELNLIEPGANYGWPEVEGVGGEVSETNGFVDPQVTWPTSEASPSGLAWLDGVLYMGALRGERLWEIPSAVIQPRSQLLPLKAS